MTHRRTVKPPKIHVRALTHVPDEADCRGFECGLSALRANATLLQDFKSLPNFSLSDLDSTTSPPIVSEHGSKLSVSYARTMAEIIGIISGVIAFGQAIEGFARGAKYIASIQGAPDEFVALQNDV